jgi:DNA primase
VPRPEPGPDSDRDEQRQDKLSALRTRLHENASALRTPADWARCLRIAALMPEHEFANILLIAAQRPDAVMVRDYKQWVSAGRHVRRNEKGIEIFAVPPQGPAKQASQPSAGEPGWRHASRVAYVWDLSQTTGQAPASLPKEGHVPARLLEALRWLARREGYVVEHEQGAPDDGTTFWAARRIRLPAAIDDDRAAWALAHQLGHILLGHGAGALAGTTSSGCAGLRKAEADSVAFIVATRHSTSPATGPAAPSSWAGTDPRAQPAAAILAAGHRITTAAARVTRHTSRLLDGDVPAAIAPAPLPHAAPTARPSAAGHSPAVPRSAGTAKIREAPAGPSDRTRRILRDTQDFYLAQLGSSWAPRYLSSRGINVAVAAEWDIGYAPGGWTALTGHLRGLGYRDDEIEGAGVASRSSRGTLIDRFRDRVILPVYDQRGEIAGFIGRAHPDTPDGVPKYLNSPESASYKKGSLLFGLHQGCQALARGAVPVIVEGPFDAIAVTLADPGQSIGLAPCGTALTTRQAELISQAADLPGTGILVAFDADTAGRKAAARAYGILRPLTPKLQAARLNAKDPAKIFEQDGPQALRMILREEREPLSAVLIDASIAEWNCYLDHVEGRYRAMHSTASLIAGLLPEQATAQVRRITAGRKLVTVDDMARPVDTPELPPDRPDPARRHHVPGDADRRGAQIRRHRGTRRGRQRSHRQRPLPKRPRVPARRP